MKHLTTIISVLAFTNGAHCLLAEDFVIDFVSGSDDLFFFLKGNTSDFESAKKVCTSLNGRLPVSLDELKKYTLKNENFNLKNNHFWTGISKDANSVYKWQDGRYIEYHKVGFIESWYSRNSSCSQRCCALTADPQHFNVFIYSKEMAINLKEVPCEEKRSVACLVRSPHSIFINHIQPALRELSSTGRYDVPHADSIHADYHTLKKSIQKLRGPLEKLTAEIETLEKEAAAKMRPPVTFLTNNIYMHKESKSSFNETLDLCVRIGGNMLQVTNDSQSKQITSLLGNSAEYWIGFTRKSNGKYYSVADGSEFQYNHRWMPGKPDCPSSESCCALAVSTWDTIDGAGELFDAPCDHRFTSLCALSGDQSDEEKESELQFLTNLSVKQDILLMKLVSMLKQLSTSFASQ